MANRMRGIYGGCTLKNSYRRFHAYNGGDPWLNPEELSAPLRLRKPARIGVQFMGDIFHENITNEQIAAVFGVMAACHQHQFFVLTKRSDRAFEWFRWVDKREKDGRTLFPYDDAGWRIRQMLNCCVSNNGCNPPVHHGGPWPLPNVILGVSVENQETLEEREKWLRRTPAAHRFISYEPGLAPIDMSVIYGLFQVDDHKWGLKVGDRWADTPDWVVAGCETGPGARPCHLDWLRSLRDQCVLPAPRGSMMWPKAPAYWNRDRVLHVSMISEIRNPIVRLSLDSEAEKTPWSRAYEYLRSSGIAKHRIRTYCLIAFHDGPAEAWERCRWIESHGVDAYPMWFHRLDAMKANTVTDKQKSLGWNDQERRNIMQWFYQHKKAVVA